MKTHNKLPLFLTQQLLFKLGFPVFVGGGYCKELMQKGYGIGSGISLFIATNICESSSLTFGFSGARGIWISWRRWPDLGSKAPIFSIEKSEKLATCGCICWILTCLTFVGPFKGSWPTHQAQQNKKGT